jgi:uronate dehydrogenase
MEEAGMGRLLITGAAGAIGTVLRRDLGPRWDHLRGFDLRRYEPLADAEEVVVGDLRDEDQVADAVRGVTAIVHLAGIPSETGFEEVLQHNILGTYRVLEAARRHDVRRVVVASTNHVVGFHHVDEQLDERAVPRPDTYYGVAKLAGEGLASLYADKFGLDIVSVRIGTFRDRPTHRRHLSTWLSHRDAVHLFDRCLTAPLDGHVVVYGVSANTRSWWSDPARELLGYRPQDDAEAHLAAVEATDPWTAADPAQPSELRQGGSFVAWFPDAYGPR